MSTSSQNPDPKSTDRIVIDVCRDGWTKGIQLGIAQLDENDRGHGYRIAGPKYNGSSKTLLKCTLDKRDAAEIRSYLDAVFPQEAADPAELTCADCGHLESAHKPPAEEPDDGGCDASGARLAKCTCEYYIPRAAAGGAS